MDQNRNAEEVALRKIRGEIPRWSSVTEQKGHSNTICGRASWDRVREEGGEARRRGASHTGVTTDSRGRTEKGVLGLEHAHPAPPLQSLGGGRGAGR